MFVADVPLLFESGFDLRPEQVLLVATSPETQLARLKARSGFDDSLAGKILAAQWPIERKIPLADLVFWNEGPEKVLRGQIIRFLKSLSLMSEETNEPTENESATTGGATATPEKPKPPIPDKIDANEFRRRTLAELLALADTLPTRINTHSGKSQLVFEILGYYLKEGAEVEAEGIVEQSKESFAMVRDPARSFRNSADDFYLAANLLTEHGVRPGNRVKIKLRAPRDRDKFISASEILEVENIPVGEFHPGKDFDQLTSLFPEERFVMEREGEDALAVRLIDIVAPIGKGQRGLIVAPPRGGKTILLKQIARSIQANHPEVELIVLLLDERPEEVTDFEDAVDADVFASTFDEPSRRHAQVSDLVLERARRLVEQGKDVVILLDSLTRLARGYNNSIKGGGPIGSGGLSPKALQESRRFFGAARNVEEGGSLTIVATCLVETENRMDDIIFEELKGTGNMEVRLDRDLAERRIFPAIHIPQSGTRNDDRLYHPDEMTKIIEARRILTALPVGEAVETLMKGLSKTSSNAEFLLRGL
jgi:transcription termination factor Rho